MGQPKSLLPIPPANTPLLLHVLLRLQPLAGRTLIIANDPALPKQANIPDSVLVIGDQYPDTGTLGGIATGLAACDDWAMIVACDMPFVNPKLFAYFQELAGGSGDWRLETGDQKPETEDRWDAIVPVVDGYAEPLHALYHHRCLPAIERRLANGERRAICFHPDVRVRLVQEDELRRFDPELRSFVNANTPQEWEGVLKLLMDPSNLKLTSN